MSFSSRIKDELISIIPSARHCCIAEMAAYSMLMEQEDGKLVFKSEHESLLKKIFTILQKNYNIYADAFEGGLCISSAEEAGFFIGSLHDSSAGGVSPLLLKSSCCRRAYLRAAFCCCGSMSDPRRGYHLEYCLNEAGYAAQICELLKGFGIRAGETLRKGHHVVYIKESEGISEFLNLSGAHRSLMEFENLRIEKDLRNDVNRQVNCDTANIRKTLNAADRQIRAIEKLMEMGEDLPENLRDIAELRLENPEASIQELGEMMDPPLGKSGVNHRLRKLVSMAEGEKHGKDC